MITSRPTSSFGKAPSFLHAKVGKKPSSKDGPQQTTLWVPMLNDAAQGKDLPEKQMIILGGAPDQQREFLQSLNHEQPRPPRYGRDQRKPKTPPFSNRFALGYTYQDVLDADQEDTLARLNVYMLSTPSASFAPLLKPLFTAKTVKDTLVTILLDWEDPFKWPRQLRQWIRLLRSVILTLDEETKMEMEENMTAWKERRTGPDAPTTMGGGAHAEPKQTTIVPLGQGEWEEGLGVPLSVVCVHAEKIERLERDLGWQEEEFDFLMQWLRCVLLKHGASLVYTLTFDPNNVRTLVLSSLSIHSLLKREVAKHNVIERDKILVPPNWDSWGKIRILREGFDMEAVSNAWSMEIRHPPEEQVDFEKPIQDESTSAVPVFEATLPDPAKADSTYKPVLDTEVEVTVTDTQAFLTEQAQILEELKAEDEKAARRARKGAPEATGSVQADFDDGAGSGQGERHGPGYQINVNGIDFDPEEATRMIREREAERTKAVGSNTPKRDVKSGAGADTPEGGKSTEALQSFFAGLMKKTKGTGGASGSVSPTRGSPAPEKP